MVVPTFAFLITVALAFALLLPSVVGQSQEFKATFGSSPAPFQIDVNPDFIATARLKASLTRYTVDVDQPDWADGPPSHNVSTVRNYWVDEYDWVQVQAELNQQ